MKQKLEFLAKLEAVEKVKVLCKSIVFYLK